MRIRFEDIPAEGLQVEIHDQSWFPDQELKRSGPAVASLFLEPKGKKGQRVLVRGTLEVRVTLSCDRCLKSFQLPLRLSFALVLEYLGGEEGRGATVHRLKGGEMDVMQLAEPVADLFQILRQQVFLALPVKHLCREDCQGLCPRCGRNLNQGACGCPAEGRNAPFQVLAGLVATGKDRDKG